MSDEPKFAWTTLSHLQQFTILLDYRHQRSHVTAVTEIPPRSRDAISRQSANKSAGEKGNGHKNDTALDRTRARVLAIAAKR